MTQRQDNTAIMTVLEIINSNGLKGLGEAGFIFINEAMKIERFSVIKAGPWERSNSRTGYANGYKNRSVVIK